MLKRAYNEKAFRKGSTKQDSEARGNRADSAIEDAPESYKRNVSNGKEKRVTAALGDHRKPSLKGL
jgi:hypothetical protein